MLTFLQQSIRFVPQLELAQAEKQCSASKCQFCTRRIWGSQIWNLKTIRTSCVFCLSSLHTETSVVLGHEPYNKFRCFKTMFSKLNADSSIGRVSTLECLVSCYLFTVHLHLFTACVGCLEPDGYLKRLNSSLS